MLLITEDPCALFAFGYAPVRPSVVRANACLTQGQERSGLQSELVSKIYGSVFTMC